jgi:hypothetical protein
MPLLSIANVTKPLEPASQLDFFATKGPATLRHEHHASFAEELRSFASFLNAR